MKTSTIVLLSSFIIACNAELNYTDVAEKVVNKLLANKDPFNGIFDYSISSSSPIASMKVTQTKLYDWTRLELVNSSVQGSKLTRDTHNLQFKIQLPSPIIKGKLFLSPYSESDQTTEVTAIASDNIRILIRARINEYYSQAVWRSVSLSDSLKGSFESQFDCNLELLAVCDYARRLMDGESGAWNQPSKLIEKVTRLVYAIKYV